MKIGERTMPQEQCILTGLLIIITPHGFDAKSESFVQRTRSFVGSSDLECRASRTGGHGLGNHRLQQLECEATTSPGLVDGETVDVQLIKDEPAGAVGNDLSVRPPHDIEASDVGVLEFPA